MGRLFWKFFLFIWLGQMAAVFGTGALFWVERQQFAAQMLRESHIKAGVLKLCNVWPVPEKAIREVADNVSRVFSVEMNIGKYTREIARLVGGRRPLAPILKNRGIVHTPREICQAVKEEMK